MMPLNNYSTLFISISYYYDVQAPVCERRGNYSTGGLLKYIPPIGSVSIIITTAKNDIVTILSKIMYSARQFCVKGFLNYDVK